VVILESIVAFELDFGFAHRGGDLQIVGGLEVGDELAMGFLELGLVQH
jgi:hypothetical protein